MPAAQTRGGRSRPGLVRRKSSQTRSGARSSDNPIARVGTQEDLKPSEAGRRTGKIFTASEHSSSTGKPATKHATFELASSWQSDNDSSEEKTSQPVLGPTGSLVQPDFRSKFAEQRQLSSGTSLPTMAAMRKVRSSVRFADDDESLNKGKERGRPEMEEDNTTENRTRSNSQVFADSDDSEEKGELTRVQSQLSMLIQDRRKQSGSQDIGPSSQPEGGKSAEARRKREELLRMGREAAAPTIPSSRSRRTSRDAEQDRYRSPSPNATF